MTVSNPCFQKPKFSCCLWWNSSKLKQGFGRESVCMYVHVCVCPPLHSYFAITESGKTYISNNLNYPGHKKQVSNKKSFLVDETLSSQSPTAQRPSHHRSRPRSLCWTWLLPWRDTGLHTVLETLVYPASTTYTIRTIRKATMKTLVLHDKKQDIVQTSGL